jgi:hypothetical protein
VTTLLGHADIGFSPRHLADLGPALGTTGLFLRSVAA